MKDASDSRILSAVLLIILFIGSVVFIAIKVHSSLEVSYNFKYDDEGRLIGYVDAEGKSVGFTYDDKGQIIETSYPDKQVRYQYDPLGNLVAIKDGEGMIDFKYDAFGRLMAAKYNHSPEREVKFEYDPWGNVEKVKILDSSEQVANSVGYKYDMLSRLKSVETFQGRIEYSYPEENKVVRQFPNGIKSTFILSSQMSPLSIRHEDKIGHLLAEYKYEYDASGHVIRAVEKLPDIGIQENKYEWDNRGYLIGWIKPDSTKISYTYDNMGNRISKIDSAGTLKYNYDNFGRLSQAGNLKFEWDKTGKLTTQIEGDSITKIGYNGMNLPSVIKTPDATVRYDWDAAGNMISKQYGDELTYYIPNPLSPSGSVLAEFGKRGEFTSSYVYGHGLLAQQKVDGIRFFLEDGLGSIRTSTDQGGKIVGQHSYSPFGEITTSWGENPGFFGTERERWEPSSKQTFINNRLYNPELGRYLSPKLASTNIFVPNSFNSYSLNTINSATSMHQFLKKSLDIPKFVYYNPIKTPITDDRLLLRELTNDPFGTAPPIFREVASSALVSAIKEPIRTLGGPYSDSVTVFNWINFAIEPESERLLNLPNPRSLLRLSGLEGPREMGPTTLSEVALTSIGPTLAVLTAGSSEQAYKAYMKIVPMTATPVLGPTGYFGVALVNSYIDYSLRLLSTAYDPLSPMQGTNFRRIGPNAYEYDAGIYHVKIEETGNGFIKEVTSPTSVTHVKVERETTDRGVRHKSTASIEQTTRRSPTTTPFPLGGWDNGGGGSGGNIGNTILRTGGMNPLPITPFSNEKELGGIELSAKARFIGDLGRITAAVYDNETGSLVLVGDGNISLPSLSQEDLRVALKLALAGVDAQFSLDPADPKNPEGDWFKAVYFPEDILKGTKFGNNLFEADWLLKQYHSGVEVDEKGETFKRVTKIEGFKDLFDLGFENFDAEKGKTWNRLWIENDRATLQKTDGAIYFDAVDMKVKTEEEHFTGKELKGTGREDPNARKFVDFFTTHYDEFAEESSSFNRVKEMAKAVALAKWLVDLGIPIDMSWFSTAPVEDEKFKEYMQALSKRPNFKISETEKGKKFVDQVHSLSENREKRIQREYQKGRNTITETETRILNWFGGVDLTVKPDYVADDGRAKRIKEKVREAIRNNPGRTTFDFQDGEQKLKAAVLPFTRTGISLWEGSSGILNAEYTRNDDGKIQSFKLEIVDGSTAAADRTKDGGSELIITTPNEHTFHYLYDSEGYLYQMNIDGKKSADYQYNSQTRTTTIDYDRWKEQVAYDKDGRVQSYTRVPLDENQPPETIQFKYDQEGRLKEMDYGESGKINLEYKGDLLVSAKTPWGEFTYSYDSDNRLRTISESGDIINFQYDGDSLNRVAVDFQGQTAEAIFVNGFLNEVHGSNGEKMRYEYNKEGLLSSATDARGAKAAYHYDDKLRLQRIELPDGSATEYIYGIVGKGVNTKERLFKTVIHPIR